MHQGVLRDDERRREKLVQKQLVPSEDKDEFHKDRDDLKKSGRFRPS